MIEAAGGAEDCFRFDALDDTESVVWVNDLVTNLECHMSPTMKVSRIGVPRDQQSFQYSEILTDRQRKTAKNGHFCTIPPKALSPPLERFDTRTGPDRPRVTAG
jgi:hypothetical protein